MSARSAIFTKLRNALNVVENDLARTDAVAERMAMAPLGVIPARGQLPPTERLDLFVLMAEKASATVARITAIEQLPAEVSIYLKARNLPAIVRMGDDPLLRSAAWSSVGTLEILEGPSDGNDMTGLSHAIAGVAESGTLVLTSGPENPTTINFLPEHHIVVIKAADITGDLEAALGKVRKTYGKGQMPRVVNMITGPSRSGDIEQTIILGAHGPRAVHIVVLA